MEVNIRCTQAKTRLEKVAITKTENIFVKKATRKYLLHKRIKKITIKTGTKIKVKMKTMKPI